MSDIIAESDAYRNNGLVAFDQDEVDKIRTLLLGHRIAKIADDHLRLDDGTVIKVVPNDGGCACSAGDYWLRELNECDNVVTAVEFEEGTVQGETDSKWDTNSIYRVFVVAEDRRINLYAVEGDDGNGYYGTGYELLVRYPTLSDDDRAAEDADLRNKMVKEGS